MKSVGQVAIGCSCCDENYSGEKLYNRWPISTKMINNGRRSNELAAIIPKCASLLFFKMTENGGILACTLNKANPGAIPRTDHTSIVEFK